MSDIVKKIMVRAIKVRIKGGEVLEDILKSYPGLTAAEKKELKKEFE